MQAELPPHLRLFINGLSVCITVLIMADAQSLCHARGKPFPAAQQLTLFNWGKQM
jgi:hypothetical protein